ncbi:hypothetical protein COX69_04105 [Candidatus Falkowbacteria bacterium CG_4_10_14_0_2_um_filter_48_10]|uniref:Uncharacterized protein n=1 Tax=Candidatus Falkowbacteria bacterium CG23_combo_of_CG06-09_8_20_14_all_49_15 TaxID=1974572 RepID=A0A2G9ZJL0_9BACT|nr:MAG: hypothetical protein COX22_04785 [Candidatus Falkowbacteria bacterium CG23_combo_of_CG06-09_8_20_14_all_49_15]PJA07664.1 MAG: hypothetical protein COX69_04105 [Candidatus Falkowbacteria bacterium CG_4_10_14_0_2_um_filter_48_10]
MKKQLNLAAGFFLLLAAGGAVGCFFIIEAGGAGPLKSWLFGAGPLFVGIFLAIILLALKDGWVMEGECPRCGKKHSLFARRGDRVVRGANVLCDCGRILWLPLGRERPTMFFN